MAERIGANSSPGAAAGAPARSPAVHITLVFASSAVAAALSSWAGSRLPLATKLIELALCVAAWEVAAAAMIGLLRHRLGPARFGASPWPLFAAMGLASLPATAAMMMVFLLVGERIASAPLVYGESLLIGLLIAFARRGISHPPPSPPQVPVSLAEPETSAVLSGQRPAASFLARHAPTLSGPLLALEAEDHYLRVHARGGTALILMRLRDAVAELGAETGWQPHRSWWVDGAAEARMERCGTKHVLVLPCGLTIPVSRANTPAARERMSRRIA